MSQLDHESDDQSALANQEVRELKRQQRAKVEMCPACTEKRLHTPEERLVYHPLAGHGWQDGHSWTSPEAEQAHLDEVRAWKGKTDGTTK